MTLTPEKVREAIAYLDPDVPLASVRVSAARAAWSLYGGVVMVGFGVALIATAVLMFVMGGR